VGAAIEAKGLGFRVGQATLLESVDLELESGALTAVVGPNGAGKSTLLRLLAGDLRPTNGKVLLAGEPLDRYDYDDLALRRSVFVQQTVRDIPFAVEAVVAMGRSPHQRRSDNSSEDDSRAVVSALERTATAHLKERVFATLSSGEQTRVSLARVFAQDTDVLLLDEPTTALDVAHEERVMSELRLLARRDRAVLAVLHDLNAAANYATRVVVVSEGKVRAVGSPESVFTDELLTEVYGQPMRVVDHPFRDCPLILVADR